MFGFFFFKPSCFLQSDLEDGCHSGVCKLSLSQQGALSRTVSVMIQGYIIANYF